MASNECVFVSYAREDAAYADRIAQDLRNAGVQLWIDRRSISPGSVWNQSIEDALNQCKGTFVLLSRASVVSSYVQVEVNATLRQGKKVVPLLIEPCDVPPFMSRMQSIDFTQGYETGLEHLLYALGVGQHFRQVKPWPPFPWEVMDALKDYAAGDASALEELAADAARNVTIERAELRKRAVELLEKMGDVGGRYASRVALLVYDPDPGVREAARKCLRAMGNAGAPFLPGKNR